MPQNGQTLGQWALKVKEQADRCEWTGYNAKNAAREAILFQTDKKKLMKKIVAEDIDYDDTIKAGLAMEQDDKKVEEMRGKNYRKEEEKVARLDETYGPTEWADLKELVRALKNSVKPVKAKQSWKSNSCKTCTREHRNGQTCPAKDRDCNDCGKTGHFRGSVASKKTKRKEKARAVDSSLEDTDDESVERVKEEMSEDVRAVKADSSEMATVTLVIKDHGIESEASEIKLVIDSGVNKTLLSLKDWRRIRLKENMPKMRLKKNYSRFSPFGTKVKLPILGRSTVRMTAGCGRQVETMVYVVDGETESLLRLRDCRALGIIDIQPDGRMEDKVNCISYQKKMEQVKKGKVSGGQTQKEIDSSMKEITAKHPAVFKGLGRAKVEPIHIKGGVS